MIIRFNDLILDTQYLRCNRTTQDKTRCQQAAGDKGIVEIATDEIGGFKLDVTCGTHVNHMAGNDVRFNTRIHAIENNTLVNHHN